MVFRNFLIYRKRGNEDMRAKKKIVMLLSAILLTNVIPSSIYADEAQQQELQKVMQEINQKNEQLNASSDSTDIFRYNFKNKKSKLTKKDNAIMWKEYKKKKVKKSLSASLAKKEVAWLFRLFRSQYGLYAYYGGDAKFEEAQKAIIKEIKKQDTIKVKKYQKLLHDHLNFINDAHLAIGEELFLQDIRLFSDESVHYIKKGENFYKEEDLEEDAIIRINGRQPDIYLKHAIDEDGSLTYYPYAMLKQEDNSCNYNIEYQSGKTESILLKPAKYSYKETVDRMYGYDQYESLAYVEMNLAYMKEELPEERKRFLKDVSNMKKQDCLIFDLRNNPGGDGTLIDEWFQDYTGQALQPNYNTLRIRPIWINSAKEMKKEDKYFIKSGLKKDGKYYYLNYPNHQYLKNEGKKVFVLTSRRTSSSAEAMTDALRNIENTVVIGTNTGGVLINMANYQMAMPYSGLFLQFGECLQNFEPSYFKESYGMEPDIYLTGENLSERLKKFFEKYVI